jgi:hypothetical protein
VDKIIGILIAAAIAFITIAIAFRVRPLRHVLMGHHAMALAPHKGAA